MQVAVILNEVKNLFFLLQVRNQRKTTEILRCAQNDNELVRNDQPPEGRGEPDRPVILPRPTGEEAGTASFRGRVRGSPIPRLNGSIS